MNKSYSKPSTDLVVLQAEGRFLSASDEVNNLSTAASANQLPSFEVTTGWESSYNDNPFND